MMQQQDGCVAILPQPFVSLAKILVNPLYIPIDLTVEWDRAFADTGSQAVTTTTIVNRQFLEEHEQAVVEYLNMAGQSVSWTLANMSDAAALQEELGTFLNNSVALDAMPYISMVNLTGEDMRTALSGFLRELYLANPDSIGGKMPGEDFYYLPPEGQLDERFLQAGLEQATQHESSAGTGNGGVTASAADAQAAVEALGRQVAEKGTMFEKFKGLVGGMGARGAVATDVPDELPRMQFAAIAAKVGMPEEKGRHDGSDGAPKRHGRLADGLHDANGHGQRRYLR